ncbi:hypothetical protein IT575_13550 [bacterium]|nr:hypothetical protein [bacterium]
MIQEMYKVLVLQADLLQILSIFIAAIVGTVCAFTDFPAILAKPVRTRTEKTLVCSAIVFSAIALFLQLVVYGASVQKNRELEAKRIRVDEEVLTRLGNYANYYSRRPVLAVGVSVGFKSPSTASELYEKLNHLKLRVITTLSTRFDPFEQKKVPTLLEFSLQPQKQERGRLDVLWSGYEMWTDRKGNKYRKTQVYTDDYSFLYTNTVSGAKDAGLKLEPTPAPDDCGRYQCRIYGKVLTNPNSSITWSGVSYRVLWQEVRWGLADIPVALSDEVLDLGNFDYEIEVPASLIKEIKVLDLYVAYVGYEGQTAIPLLGRDVPEGLRKRRGSANSIYTLSGQSVIGVIENDLNKRAKEN